MFRQLIAPLTVALVAVNAGSVFAQGAFPAPLPGAAPSSNSAASPFPPVNGVAPAASVGAPSAFPSGGAAPITGGFSAPPPQQQQAGPPGGDECMKRFIPLKEEAEKRGQAIKAASARRAPPDEACKLIGSFGQSEIKMIRYVETNSQKCGIPAQIATQMKDSHKNTEQMQKKVCDAAQQMATRGPAGPSLSEALGSSAALPEVTPTKRGGSTFDTLNGNVLSR